MVIRSLVLILMFLNAFLILLANANHIAHLDSQPAPALALALAPAPAPAAAPLNSVKHHRKHGKHYRNIQNLSPAPSFSPSEQPYSLKESTGVHGENSPMGLENTKGHINIDRHKLRHKFDKSIAGAGVIIVGLVAAFVLAIFFYIRATRSKNYVLPQPGTARSRV